MNKLVLALFIAAMCTSKALAWGGQYGNGTFGQYPSSGYGYNTPSYQSPTYQPIGPCGNGFGGGTAITVPSGNGGSTTFYNGNGYSGTAITVPSAGGGSTTFY